MTSPQSQFESLVGNECFNTPAQNPSNGIAFPENQVNNNVPFSPANNTAPPEEQIHALMGLDVTPPTDDSATPVKDDGSDTDMSISQEEQTDPAENSASPTHLVMEILDEVLSTPCSSTKEDKVVRSHDQVETIEDIQAFMDKPVSSFSNDAKITPEKDDTVKDHSKVARKLNMETEKNPDAKGIAIRKKSQKKSGKEAKTRMSRSTRSGLVFPVSRVMGQLRKGKYAKHIGVTSAVYLTAVLEYLVAEVLELSGNCAKYYNKRRVFPRCILLTLRHDAELDQLTKGAIVPQGGVKPFIHRELLPVERQDSHFHPRFGGFLSTQDMMKYNLKPSFPEDASPSSSQAFHA